VKFKKIGFSSKNSSCLFTIITSINGSVLFSDCIIFHRDQFDHFLPIFKLFENALLKLENTNMSSFEIYVRDYPLVSGKNYTLDFYNSYFVDISSSKNSMYSLLTSLNDTMTESKLFKFEKSVFNNITTAVPSASLMYFELYHWESSVVFFFFFLGSFILEFKILFIQND
jgi:hypothetical protein